MPVTRGSKLVQMALNGGKKYDEYQFSSDSEQKSETNHERNSEPLDESNGMLEYDVDNIDTKLPTDICDGIKKTSDWINQNNFLEKSKNFEEPNSLPSTFSKSDEHTKKRSSKTDSECSYISPSEVDDSDMDKNYIPDDDDISSHEIPLLPVPEFSSDHDSFAHRSLSSHSSENATFNKKENLFVESVSLEKKVFTKAKKPKKTRKKNNAAHLPNDLTNLSCDNVSPKKIQILSNVVIPNKKENYEDLHINTNKNNVSSFPIIASTSFQQTDLLPCSDVCTTEPLSDTLKKREQKNKKLIRCTFCEEDIANKNFMRHLQRRHKDETEVAHIFNLPINSKERRQAFAILRNNTNFNLYIAGTIRPNRHSVETNDEKVKYYPCAYCKGIFTKHYLKRHAKSCMLKENDKNLKKFNQVTRSQTMMACAMDPTKVISRLNVKEQVFDLMKSDAIAFEAKKDLLIAHFGDSYLKKHKRERMVYACSNRMRELSRLLISFREIKDDEKITFSELLHPKHFDNVLFATRRIVGYDHEKKTFKAPSLAMHLGTSLKLVCDELTHLILKQSVGFRCKSVEDARTWMSQVKYFKKLVEARWNIEMASLANKELQEKKWKKPLLLPLVSDIKKFRDEVTVMAEGAISKLSSGDNDKKAYKLLNKCSLALLILFNRRRIGDVQYLKIEDYKADKRSNYTDFENALTETEKTLTKKYKRVLNSGKGSRAVVILIPELLEKMINTLLEHRDKYILDKKNEYVFAMPDSSIKWGKGDVAIRELCAKVKLENPDAVSSNKLRKQIATVTQILNLKPDEAKQFSNFMGHTQKTHDEFYELPVDVYQTAKVSKLLLMMEKGSVPIEYKGKCLEEIDFNPDLEYAEEDKDDGKNPAVENDAPGFYAQEPIITVNPEYNDFNINDNLNIEQNQNPFLGQQHTDSNKADDDSDDCTSNQLETIATAPKKRLSSKEQTNKSKKEKNEVNTKVVTKNGRRVGWSNNELHLLKKEFGSYIRKGTYPPGEDIKVFIAKTGIQRTVMVIKSKIQHLIKTKNT